jgi:hypothetical protein
MSALLLQAALPGNKFNSARGAFQDVSVFFRQCNLNWYTNARNEHIKFLSAESMRLFWDKKLKNYLAEAA